MQTFPKHNASLLYRVLTRLLQSRLGILVLLFTSSLLTALLFLLVNQVFEKSISWQENGWAKRLEKGHEADAKCDAMKNAYRNSNKDDCEKITEVLKEKTRLNIIDPLGKVQDRKFEKILEPLNTTLLERKEKELAAKNHRELEKRLEADKSSEEAKKRPKEKSVYILLSGIQKKEGTTPTKDEPYLSLYAFLEIAFLESKSERFLQARLWVIAGDQQPRFSRTLHGTLLKQEKWLIGLWPTQTLLEPKDIGRWLTHNFKQLAKEEFEAGYLLPETKLLKRTESFLSSWMQTVFAHRQLSFTEESFWLTFFNGTNHWGLIQWISLFFSVFVLLQILLRFILTEMESLLFIAYRKTHPIDFRKQEEFDTLYQIRSEFTNDRSEFPRLQSFFLLRVMDREAQQGEAFLNDKIETSRKMIDFLVASLSSIGFIGTITGIAFAINQAHQVVTPDEFLRLQAIKSLSTDLALAFSTTFVALVLTIICDFFVKQQWKKEDLLLEEIKVIHQAWIWQSKETPFEQAQSSLPPHV